MIKYLHNYYIAFLTLSLSFFQADAFIVNAQTWRVWNESQQRYNYCYCFADVHVMHPINQVHYTALVPAIAHQGNKNEKLVLAEDITSFQSCDNVFARSFHENTAKVCCNERSVSPIHSLVGTYAQHTVAAKSIENRWQHQAIHGMLSLRTLCTNLDHLQKTVELLVGPQPAELFSAATTLDEALENVAAYHHLTIGDVIQELQLSIAAINTHNDNSILTAYYKKTIERIYALLQEVFEGYALQELTENEQTVFSFYRNLPAEKQAIVIDHFGLFNAEIVDMQALHELYGAQDKNQVYILAGALHIANIETVLPLLGYEKIEEFGCHIKGLSALWHDHGKTYYNAIDVQLFDTIVQTTEPSWRYYIRNIVRKIANYFR